MRTILSLFFAITAITALSQNAITGKLTLLNNENPSFEKITLSCLGQSIHIGQKGEFKIEQAEINSSDELALYLLSDQYIVVNEGSMFFNPKDPKTKFDIQLADKTELKNDKKKISENLKKRLENEFIIENARLQDNPRKLSELTEKKQIALNLLDEIAKNYSEINISKLNKTAQLDFQSIKKDEVLEVWQSFDINNFKASLKSNFSDNVNDILFYAQLAVINLDFKTAYDLYKLLLDSKVFSETGYKQMAIYFMKLNNYDLADSLYKVSLQYSSLESRKARIYNYQANLYANAKEYSTAKSSYEKAIVIWKNLLKNPVELFKTELIKADINLLILYKDLLQNQPTKTYYNEAIVLADETQKHLQTISDETVKNKYNNSVSYMKDYFLSIPSEIIAIHSMAYENKMKGDEILKSGNEIQTAKNYYLKAIDGYKSLIDKDPDFEYMLTLAQLYENLNLVEPDLKTKISNQTKVIEIKEKIWKEFKTNKTISVSLANSYAKHSWYLLLDRKYRDAKLYALKAYITESSLEWLQSLIALCYVFNGQFEEKAKDIYLNYRDKPYLKGTFRDLFLQTINDIEAEGVLHPDLKMAKAVLQ